MAKPATKLVPLFRKQRDRQSLKTAQTGEYHSQEEQCAVLLTFESEGQRVRELCCNAADSSVCTCNSCCYIYCSFPAQSGNRCRWHRRRRSEFQHPSIPQRKNTHIMSGKNNTNKKMWTEIMKRFSPPRAWQQLRWSISYLLLQINSLTARLQNAPQKWRYRRPV